VYFLFALVSLGSGDSGAPTHICLAGQQCGATLLPTKSGGSGPPPYSHGVGGYFGLYGTGQFDGQNSGHDFLGTVKIHPDQTNPPSLSVPHAPPTATLFSPGLL